MAGIRPGTAAAHFGGPVGEQQSRVGDLLVQSGIVPIERVVCLGAQLGRQIGLEERLDVGCEITRFFAEIELDSDLPRLGERGRLARIKPPSGLFEQTGRIAQHQGQSLGAQIVEVDVVFGRQTIPAEGVERLGDRLSGRPRVPPQRQRNFRAGAVETVGNVADRAPDQKLSALGGRHDVGQRMRYTLERADELAELDALRRIRCGKAQRLARNTGECRCRKQLPFLDAGGERCDRVGAACKELAVCGIEPDPRHGRAGQIG